MSKEALKLALELLDRQWQCEQVWSLEESQDVANIIREALAEQPAQQEPVAYGIWDTMLGKDNRMMMVRLDKGQDGCAVPLYTTPPQRIWQGLTDEEFLDIARTFGAQPWPPGSCVALGQMVEAKLKEKNA